MKPFIGDDFLLSTKTAEILYRDYAAKMPVFDYHCHVSPEEIANDRAFDNISQIWLSGDHYKWRLMRACGSEEKYVTGDAPDFEKFRAFAAALPRAAGNPVYHWAHLELKRYFDCDLVISPETAGEIWELCNEKLRGGLTARKIIKASNVTAICTTDDPADSLEWHVQMKSDADFDTDVRPAFRPDRAFNAEKPDFREYMGTLGKAAGIPIKTLDDVYGALKNRMDFFHKNGCRISDHGLDYMFRRENEETAGKAFLKAMNGKTLSLEENECYKTALLFFCGKEYHRRKWAMQLHFNVVRSVNTAMFRTLGADTGFDCIRAGGGGDGLIRFLDALAVENRLPKTVLYSLEPSDSMLLATIAGCFHEAGVPSKVRLGAAWWFNDTKAGIIKQLTAFADTGVLGNFTGMLTDSRSFLSYTRHEYFRRILCDMLGGWAENGEYPADTEALGRMVSDISYNNALEYFLGDSRNSPSFR
ncbi:MAG: glucuronate isomerase [Oscillospiraceae bacterium]|jgi:glucuronate isomerase|nr:glucuronate isomerase [Oscillospiraceae bacterium]